MTVDSDPEHYARPFAADGARFSIPEFAPAKGVLVAYIDQDSLLMNWGGFGVPLALLKLIAMHDHLFVLVSPPTESTNRKVMKELRQARVNMGNVHLLPTLLDSWWTRDFGPYFVNRQVGASQEILVEAHTYNRVHPVTWDEGGCRRNDNHVPCRVAKYLGIPCEVSNLVLTGGNFMADEWSTAASTGLGRSDNPQLTGAQFDSALITKYGVANLITFPDPQATYIDHVDTFSKFIGGKRVVVGSVPDGHPDTPNYPAIVALFEGQGYTVLRVPIAAHDGDGGFVQGFFMNSLALNNRLYVPVITPDGPTSTVAANLNEDALQAWRSALGNTWNVLPVKYVPSFEDFPMTPATWHQWFTWDALHCRLHEIPDISFWDPDYAWPFDRHEGDHH